MKSGEVQLIFNTTEDAKAIADSFELRRTALTNSVPYSTTVAGARAAVKAIEALKSADLAVAPLQSYLQGPCCGGDSDCRRGRDRARLLVFSPVLGLLTAVIKNPRPK